MDIKLLLVLIELVYQNLWKLSIRRGWIKSWVYSDKNSRVYDDGVKAFIEYATAHGVKNDEGNLKCPCIHCKNFDFRDNDIIYEHLVCDEMLSSYMTWFHHGERIGTTSTLETRVESIIDDGVRNTHNGDDINGMLRDLHPGVNESIDSVADETI
ncbi:hypothetical protein BVC80_8617g10 [Macleaya cordata]|uniref:Transposase-associated domain-containing protein n=1 Tax=Macleaya cordata TaxID=56857 RepID=A0A200PTA7_MACCD|nr:hypothetical protein BVC80_8617g10 [Macleaya cordata]